MAIDGAGSAGTGMVRSQLLTVWGLIESSLAIFRIDIPPVCIAAARHLSDGA